VPFEDDGIANAQAAPTHEQRHRAQAYPQVLNRNETASRVSVVLGGIENSLEFIGREIVGRNLNDLDVSQSECGISRSGSGGARMPRRSPLRGSASSCLARCAEVEKGIEFDLVDVLKSLRLGPGEELFFEDGLKFVECGLVHVAADRIGEVASTAFLTGMRALFGAAGKISPSDCAWIRRGGIE
jgi:hypothetical protein